MAWQPRHDDPLFILAMDHRASFGKTLFGVVDDHPDRGRLAAMTAAKQLIYDGLREARTGLAYGRAGVLVDEQYGQAVIDAARRDRDAVTLAVPIEASGHDWFTPQWGDDWDRHIEAIRPDYAKVLVRDNPGFDAAERDRQLRKLAEISRRLHQIDIPLLYELLVPATDAQLAAVGDDEYRYDRDIRPALVLQVIADNQRHGVEPALWKIEGLETVEACDLIAGRARAGGRTADLIVLGRDAPAERLGHWVRVAAEVPAFVGFAIGRSIWEDVIRDFAASERDEAAAGIARQAIAERYLGFVADWTRPAR
jgi:myo-inositol catabolism protein IolC